MTSARMITTFEDKTVIGRKEHRCDLCGCRIEKGERHRMQRNLFDGAFYVWREHLVCHSVASQLKMYKECDDGLTESIFQELLIDKAVELDVEYNNRPYKEVAEDILRLLSDPSNP